MFMKSAYLWEVINTNWLERTVIGYSLANCSHVVAALHRFRASGHRSSQQESRQILLLRLRFEGILQFL